MPVPGELQSGRGDGVSGPSGIHAASTKRSRHEHRGDPGPCALSARVNAVASSRPWRRHSSEDAPKSFVHTCSTRTTLQQRDAGSFHPTTTVADCDISYTEAIPSTFSFNSPIGACESCRGFGRTMGIDYSLVIPDESKSLAEGADQAVADQEQPSMSAGSHTLTQRHASFRSTSPGNASSKAHKCWVLEGEDKQPLAALVRRQGFFRLARKKELSHAHPGSAFALPLLRRPAWRMQRLAAQARSAGLAIGLDSPTR